MFTDGPIILDDWKNDGSNPVVGLRWWGAFADWREKTLPGSAPQVFHIGIWSDDYYTHAPSTLLWEKYSTGWSWAYAGALQDPLGEASGDSCFEFVQFISQDEWFPPTATNGTRYWISISSVYETHAPSYAWGWITRGSQFEQAAVMMNELWSISLSTIQIGSPHPGDVFRQGVAITHPPSVPWDMAFDIISTRPAKGSGGGGAANAEVDEQTSDNSDLNGDGVVDIQDISMLMRLWLDD
jgi:hypothetical protein